MEHPCAAREEGGSGEKLPRTNLQTLAQCMIVPGSIEVSSRIAVWRLEAFWAPRGVVPSWVGTSRAFE